MRLSTATEEVAHIEMLATAVALNLEGAPPCLQEEAARQDPAVAAVLGGMNARHFLSAGLATLPINADGVPFNTSHVYACGNIVGDMYANVVVEATGRTLATRLYELTDDTGVQDRLAAPAAVASRDRRTWRPGRRASGPE